MVALTDPKKPAERHDGIGDLSRTLVEHHVIDLAKMLAFRVVYVGSGHLAGRDDVGTWRKRFRITAGEGDINRFEERKLARCAAFVDAAARP